MKAETRQAGERESKKKFLFLFADLDFMSPHRSVPVLFSEEKRSSNKLKEIENKVVDDVYARADELSFKITK